MVLGDLNRTRRLAGNPATTNVSDADITEGLAFGTSQVTRITGKTNWETDTAHLDYAAAVTAAEYFASSYIRDRFNDQSDISGEHSGRGYMILRSIADSLSNSATAGTAIAVKKYRSYPLNPSATIYKGTDVTGQELIGSEDYYSSQFAQ